MSACGTWASTDPGATLTVMTRNLDEGTDFGPLVKATTASQFLSAAAAAWEEVEASDILQRAAAVAGEIARYEPELVSLEEASIWRTGPFLKPPATTVVYNALATLLSALAADGAAYRLVVVQNEFDLEGPTTLGYDVRVTDQDAILARENIDVSDVESGNYHHELTLTPVGMKETILRGWTSADVTVGDHTVRYVETHLESFSNSVQTAQARELLAGPAHTNLPVILACDCNTGPGVTPTYKYLISKGRFTDTWAATNPRRSGYTWPLHKEDPYVPTATPYERIDLILVRGAITPVTDTLFGNSRASLTSSGSWPSDHAGLIAKLTVR